MNNPPSLLKILTIDYAAFLGWLVPVTMWAFYIFLQIVGNIYLQDITYLVMVIGFSVIGLTILLWRILTINIIFNDNIQTMGTISHLAFFRDRGRVEYVYTYQAQKFCSGNGIHKVKQTEQIKIGSEVVLVVDRNNPKRAFIRDLYI